MGAQRRADSEAGVPRNFDRRRSQAQRLRDGWVVAGGPCVGGGPSAPAGRQAGGAPVPMRSDAGSGAAGVAPELWQPTPLGVVARPHTIFWMYNDPGSLEGVINGATDLSSAG